MSYAFDVLATVWDEHIRPYVPNEEIAMRFEMLFETMHSANHNCNLQGSNLIGDGVNKHSGVTSDARKLDELDKKVRSEGDSDADNSR